MLDNLKEKAEKHFEKAKKKLEAAKLLLEKEFFDDSVSRAYYAMYHAAKAVLILKNIDPQKHAGVVSMFGLHFVNEGLIERYLGSALAYAKETREIGDYEEFMETSKDTAEAVIDDAENFLEKVGALLQKMLAK